MSANRDLKIDARQGAEGEHGGRSLSPGLTIIPVGGYVFFDDGYDGTGCVANLGFRRTSRTALPALGVEGRRSM